MPITSETSGSCPNGDLPVLPVSRAAHCPLAPPADFVNCRQSPGYDGRCSTAIRSGW